MLIVFTVSVTDMDMFPLFIEASFLKDLCRPTLPSPVSSDNPQSSIVNRQSTILKSSTLNPQSSILNPQSSVHNH